VLLVAASVFYRDICQVVKPAKDPLLWTRMSVIGFAVVSAILALKPVAGIVEITVFSGSLYAVCFLPAILLGLHWRRGSGVAVLASMGVGVLVLVGWLLLGLRSIMHEVFPALIVSFLAYVLVAQISQPALKTLPGDQAPDA
jgi:Na+/proline symporter